MGLSDLHGDGRLHPRNNSLGPPGQAPPSGFGFELTFRLVRVPGERHPPTWPATLMQQVAKYVFNSGNLLMPGDHISWHSPVDPAVRSKITQILMARDPQLPNTLTPHGEVSFVQIVGVTSDELQAAQHWNGNGLINLLKTTSSVSAWLVTDTHRTQSVIEEDPTIAEKVQSGIEREGSNLSGVSAKCWWDTIPDMFNPEKYRENKQDSDEEEEEEEVNDELDTKPNIKSERLSPAELIEQTVPNNVEKPLTGLHLTFNLEAGSLLPLAIKGRVMHGRHFTFKSILSHAAVTFVASTVTGTMVSEERPYVVQGPWLQVLIPDQLAETMAQEFEVLNNPDQIQLPKTFSWPEYRLVITITNN